MSARKTPQQIWDQYKKGYSLDTGHQVQENTNRNPDDRDFVHAYGDSWERKGGTVDWILVRQQREGI